MREAVADRLQRQTGRAYDPLAEVVISSETPPGVLSALLATVDHGDEVIVTDPTYAGFIGRIRLVGARPVFVPLVVVNDRWRLDLDRLRDAVTSKTRAALLMSPSMPSGQAALDPLTERTVTLGGVLENYRMIGWRTGWAAVAVMGDVAFSSTSPGEGRPRRAVRNLEPNL